MNDNKINFIYTYDVVKTVVVPLHIVPWYQMSESPKLMARQSKYLKLSISTNHVLVY